MDYSTADTIATRLSKLNPWQFDEHTRSWPTPMHSCIYCHYGRYVNEPNMYNTHAGDCLWVAAARYADELDSAAVASQEPAESPIESRVSELLGETLWKAPACATMNAHISCVANMCGCECHANRVHA